VVEGRQRDDSNLFEQHDAVERVGFFWGTLGGWL
jgi:hypothetical protein